MRKLISQLVKGVLARDARTHASSIAFFFFMAIIPLLLLMASVVPFFGISADHIIHFFQEVLPADSAPMTGDIIREAFAHSSVAFSVSAIMLLWTASRGISALIEGLNSVYDEKETRGFAKLTLLSFGYTLALMAFLSAAIYLIFSGRVIVFLRETFPQIRLPSGFSTFLEYLGFLVAGCLFFCLVYRYLPSGKRLVRRQFPGAFFASAGWVFLSMGLRVYVSLFNSFTRFYGSMATVILVLFWFYWIFFILLIGGYVNAHLSELLPGRFLAFYYEKKTLSLVASGLFLLGLFSYVSECFVNCRLFMYPSFTRLTVLFRILTIASWLGACRICVRQMEVLFSRKEMLVLILLIAGSAVFVRRFLFSNLFVYLIVLTVWDAAILYMCLQAFLNTVGEPPTE